MHSDFNENSHLKKLALPLIFGTKTTSERQQLLRVHSLDTYLHTRIACKKRHKRECLIWQLKRDRKSNDDVTKPRGQTMRKMFETYNR